MTAEVKETKYEKAQVPDEERCLFTKRDGSRCKSAHMGNASRQCILHEGRNQKADEAEAQAIAEQLLANDVELRTKDDVNRLTSQLFTMVAAKKISRQDGSLLAYIASVLLQTIEPVRKKPNVERVEEFFESVAPPIREEQRPQFPRHNAGVFGEQAGTLGKNHNPYLHPGKVR
jgi:signal recognition particle GTPase